ncbi:MAG: hypothetical protein ABJ242_07360 [Marinomonas sp.]
MFGFGKKKPLVQGPVEFTSEAEINAAASVIYSLLDVSGPHFTHVLMGGTVTMIEEGEAAGLGRFELKAKNLDDLTFHLHVTQAEPNLVHSHECVIEPLVGRLIKTVDTVEIEEIGPGKCRVVQTVSATFQDGLSDRSIAKELVSMTMSAENALEKLAIHAEEGIDAVSAYEDEYF